MESGSIFDHASNQYKKKSAEPTPKTPPSESAQPLKPVTPAELRKMFDEVYKLNDAVSKRLEEAYKLMGLSPNDVKNYLDNPANYRDNTQWKNAQMARNNLISRVEKTILFGGKEPTKKEKQAKELKEKKQKDDAADKKRKGKTLGSRKGWMSM